MATVVQEDTTKQLIPLLKSWARDGRMWCMIRLARTHLPKSCSRLWSCWGMCRSSTLASARLQVSVEIHMFRHCSQRDGLVMALRNSTNHLSSCVCVCRGCRGGSGDVPYIDSVPYEKLHGGTLRQCSGYSCDKGTVGTAPPSLARSCTTSSHPAPRI